MTYAVPISDFRQHLSEYIQKARQGETVIVKDGKRKQELVRLVPGQRWDPVAYERALRRAAGVFTAKNHPEWATLKKVHQWLRKTRLASNRDFSKYVSS